MADDFLADLAQEAADLDSVPTEKNSARLRKIAMELVEQERTVRELDDKLKRAKERRWQLQMKEIPDLMAEIRQDRIGLPDANVDIVSEPYTHANIAAEWEEERREAGFAHLDDLGAGDLVKTTVTVVFPRGMDNELKEWLEKVRGLNLSFEPPEMVQGKMVPWNTLTAFVKEQVQRGTVLDLEKLGATVGTIAKIKKRN